MKPIFVFTLIACLINHLSAQLDSTSNGRAAHIGIYANIGIPSSEFRSVIDNQIGGLGFGYTMKLFMNKTIKKKEENTAANNV